MSLRLISSLLLLALVVALSGCDRPSDSLPERAIAANTTAVMKINLAGISYTDVQSSIETLANMAQESTTPQVVQGAGLLGLSAMQMDPEVNPESKKFFDARDSLMSAGIRAICIVIPENSTDATEMVYLLQGSDRSTLETVSQALLQVHSTVADKSPEPRVVDLGGRWYHLTSTGKALPELPSAQVAAQLDAALTSVSGSAMAVAFILSPESRSTLLESASDVNPMAGALLGGFQKPLLSLANGAMGVNLGADPAILMRGYFEDEASAVEFTSTWNQTLKGLGMFLGAMAAQNQAGDAGAMDLVNRMATALEFKRDGQSVQMTLDAQAWTLLLK